MDSSGSLATIEPYSESIDKYDPSSPLGNVANCDTETHIDISTKRKCGEVIYSSRNIISFSCGFCGAEHLQLEYFLSHLLQHDLCLVARNGTHKQSNKPEYQDNQTATAFCSYEQTTVKQEEVSCEVPTNFPFVAANEIEFDPETIHTSDETSTTSKQCIQSKIQAEASFKCNICDKTINDLKIFKAHMRRHKEKRLRTCEFCNATFNDATNLRVHRNRHLGIKPYHCTLCDKSFTSSSERKLHMRTHTGERPFKCSECDQCYNSSANLTAHKRRHRNERRFVCATCGKQFYDGKMLREHEVVHSDARPHVCVTCQAAFPRRKALMQHLKLHSGVKEYQCKVCNKSFAQNAGLYSHLKTHHPKSKDKSV